MEVLGRDGWIRAIDNKVCLPRCVYVCVCLSVCVCVCVCVCANASVSQLDFGCCPSVTMLLYREVCLG